MVGKIPIFGFVLACGLASGMYGADTGVTQGLNRFSASLYQQLAKEDSGNLIFSPFNVSTALSMALAGAQGGTAAEISKVLGQPSADPRFHADLAALLAQITKAGNTGGNQLLNANGLWVQKGFNILPQFRDTLQNTYHAPPSLVDFKGAPESARSQINAWTAKRTNDKIRELFASGALGGSTRLVLSSAVYFYGKWESAFLPSKTRPAPFYLPNGTTEQANFMNQTQEFGYAEMAAGQILEMRYAGTGLAFDILLPKKGEPVESIEKGIASGSLTGWLGTLENRSVRVSIPKFRVESQFPLVDVLKQLGMSAAFSDAADFSGIDDRRDLQLSQVIHKAYVDVSEVGTEAAAATGVGIMTLSVQVSSGPTFQADHPFVFLIRDTRSGLILFTGRLMDPKR